MDSKKIYRILSLLFLVLTVLFFVLYLRETKVKGKVSDEFITEAVTNIREHGVKISRNVIDTAIPHEGIYYFEVPDADEHDNIIVDELVTRIFGDNALTSRFETPNGVSVSIYSADNSNELGRIVFDNSDFSFLLIKKGVNVSGTEKPVTNGRTDLLTDENTKLLSLICNNLTNGSEMDTRISGCSGDSESFVVTVLQTVDGHDISDSYINFTFDENELVSVSGKWIVEEPKEKYNNKLTDGVNALYSLDFQQIDKITQQRIVYVMNNAESKRYYLIPMWEISYVSKNGNKVKELVDAI